MARLCICNNKRKRGEHIPPHSDTDPSFNTGQRVHLSMHKNDQVGFIVGDKKVTMCCDRAYEINNGCNHEVVNRGTDNRTHLVFDDVLPDALES
ncbi:MAG: aspartyl/asparaginyl beta-hydroxylase domain-containing protein [Woeseia sp.]